MAFFFWPPEGVNKQLNLLSIDREREKAATPRRRLWPFLLPFCLCLLQRGKKSYVFPPLPDEDKFVVLRSPSENLLLGRTTTSGEEMNLPSMHHFLSFSSMQLLILSCRAFPSKKQQIYAPGSRRETPSFWTLSHS